MMVNWIELGLGVLITMLAGLMGWLKAAYDRRIEIIEANARRIEHDKHDVHQGMMTQMGVVSERVTRLESTISTALSDIDRRLTRIEGTLDSLLRAGWKGRE